jgi:hypothetical protein
MARSAAGRARVDDEESPRLAGAVADDAGRAGAVSRRIGQPVGDVEGTHAQPATSAGQAAIVTVFSDRRRMEMVAPAC